MKCLYRAMSVVLALSVSLPLRSEEPSRQENKKSELPSEKLIAELEEILEETVSEALDAQYAELNAAFERESRKLSESRAFWRKTALGEGAVMLCAACSAYAVYKLRE